MHCALHPEAVATAYCSNCGLALCFNCAETVGGRVLCPSCSRLLRANSGNAASQTDDISSPQSNPVSEPEKLSIPEKGYPYCSPNVSLVLGLIPGVGTICNGDYVKAFLQVLIFGSLVSLASSQEVGGLSPMFIILSIICFFYMPLEAYHIAKKRTLALRGITIISPFERIHFSELWTGGLAISFGTLFLVNQFVPGTLHFVGRGWPLALIGIGVYNLTRYFRS